MRKSVVDLRISNFGLLVTDTACGDANATRNASTSFSVMRSVASRTSSRNQLAFLDEVSGRSNSTRSCVTVGVIRPRSPRSRRTSDKAPPEPPNDDTERRKP
jgi:hypothetical protein